MQCRAMPDDTALYSTSGPLESFSQGRFKYRENGGVLDRPPGTVAFTESVEKCQKMSTHIS